MPARQVLHLRASCCGLGDEVGRSHLRRPQAGVVQVLERGFASNSDSNTCTRTMHRTIAVDLSLRATLRAFSISVISVPPGLCTHGTACNFAHGDVELGRPHRDVGAENKSKNYEARKKHRDSGEHAAMAVQKEKVACLHPVFLRASVCRLPLGALKECRLECCTRCVVMHRGES